MLTGLIGVLLSSEDDYKRKIELLQEQCKVTGRDFDEIERSCWPGGQVLIAQNHKRIRRNDFSSQTCKFAYG